MNEVGDSDACLYCGRWWLHREDCAQVTGVYPVTEDEDGFLCAECDADLDGSYALVESVIVCLGCAAAVELLGKEVGW